MTSVIAPEVGHPAQLEEDQAPPRRHRRHKGSEPRNWFGGSFGWIWLLIVIVPIYWIVVTSFKTRSSYFVTNPFLPGSPTLENYRFVIEADFASYFVNSVIVTLGATVPAVVVSFMAAYAIIRGTGGRFLGATNSIFLLGLAIPLQAVIIPIYLIIIKLRLYDTLLAIILPSIAFAIPLAVLVLGHFIPDGPRELFESIRLDGARGGNKTMRRAPPLPPPPVR